MLTVACVLRSGGIYDATWVARLKAGVSRHLTLPHRFVCLSDVGVPCERIPLDHQWPGWWAKVELFKLPGPVLYFDLDTAIVGDLTDLASVWADLALLRDFYAPDHYGSGVMVWSEDKPRRLYDRFMENPQRHMTARRARMGDQAFIEEEYGSYIVPLQEARPGQIVSYKIHCKDGIPPGARVVCLHGLPKFGDMPECDPVRLAWEMAA